MQQQLVPLLTFLWTYLYSLLNRKTILAERPARKVAAASSGNIVQKVSPLPKSLHRTKNGAATLLDSVAILKKYNGATSSGSATYNLPVELYVFLHLRFDDVLLIFYSLAADCRIVLSTCNLKNMTTFSCKILSGTLLDRDDKGGILSPWIHQLDYEAIFHFPKHLIFWWVMTLLSD